MFYDLYTTSGDFLPSVLLSCDLENLAALSTSELRLRNKFDYLEHIIDCSELSSELFHTCASALNF